MYIKRPVLVWDTIDDPERKDIKGYPSVRAAARVLGCSPSNGIIATIDRGQGKSLLYRRYAIKWEYSEVSWSSLESCYGFSNNCIYGYQVTTGRKYSGATIAQLGERISIDERIIAQALKKPFPCLCGGWIFATEDNDLYWQQAKIKFFLVYPEVCAYDVQREKLYMAKNRKLLAEMLPGIALGTIYQALHKKRYRAKDYILFYKKDKTDELKQLANKFDFAYLIAA